MYMYISDRGLPEKKRKILKETTFNNLLAWLPTTYTYWSIFGVEKTHLVKYYYLQTCGISLPTRPFPAVGMLSSHNIRMDYEIPEPHEQ